MINGVFKQVSAVIFALAVSFTLLVTPNTASAANVSTSGEVKPYFVNDFRNVKKNVKTYEAWSSYKRVSDNLVTGKKNGSISSNRSVTIKTDVSGEIVGLGISTGAQVTSDIGYRLTVGPNESVYMGYSAKYKVEEGENHWVDIVTGKTIKKSTYKVKKPMYGSYKLIDYKWMKKED